MEGGGQHVAREHRGDRHQEPDAEQGHQDRLEVGLREVRLDGEHDHRPKVLEDEQPEHHAPDGGIELVLFLEELDDEQGGRRRDGDAQVERGEGPLDGRPARLLEQPGGAEAEGHAQGELEQPGPDEGLAAGEELLEVDLEADQEEQQHQAQVGDGLDVGLARDQAGDLGPDEDPGEEESGDRGNLEAREERGQEARDEQGDADVEDERLAHRRGVGVGGDGEQGGREHAESFLVQAGA
ncbi:hypothetical protein D3C86_1441760 [compost metagenome]